MTRRRQAQTPEQAVALATEEWAHVQATNFPARAGALAAAIAARRPHVVATPTYGMVRGAGFIDSWATPDRDAPGLTCCERADLLNARPTFDQRIDFVFARNLPQGARPIRRAVIGDRRGDRTAAGLWPSDHGGVVVDLAR